MLKFKKIKLNKKIILCIILFMIISIFTISSSMLYLSSNLGNLFLKQIIWYLIGFIFIFFILFISSDTLYNYSLYIYLINVLLLFILLVIGEEINGSKCWFTIPGIGSFQPSEFMKIALILLISKIIKNWIEHLPKKITFKNEIILFIKIIGICLIPFILTFLEPDTGAIFIYSIIVLSMLFISPIRKRWFIIGLSIIIIFISSFLSIYFFNQTLFTDIFGTDLFYRIDRLLDWKNGTGMQLENSLTAIGSSGLFGHGYKNTPIYFPESGTDFIFAVYASNFGLIGSIFLIGLITIFDLYLIEVFKNSKNIEDKLIIVGITGMIFYQQFQNIGMTLGILPITGITLPFISYGGSSLLSYLILIGIVLSISSKNKQTIN